MIAIGTIVVSDAHSWLRSLPDNSIDCCVTSPPYFMVRDYGHAGQIGREGVLLDYVSRLRDVFAEVRRVLKPDGVLWLNLGDSYSKDTKWGGATGGKHRADLHGKSISRERTFTGVPNKSLLGVPWRVAFALQDEGWILRSDVIWEKPNALPESVKDRVSKAHEYVFMMTKTGRYHFDMQPLMRPLKPESQARAVRGQSADHKGARGAPGQRRPQRLARERSKQAQGDRRYAGFNDRYEQSAIEMAQPRSVWRIATKGYRGAHFATMPLELARLLVVSGCPEGGLVIDPFMGAGTTAVAAIQNARHYAGCDLNPDYVEQAQRRLSRTQPGLMGVGWR